MVHFCPCPRRHLHNVLPISLYGPLEAFLSSPCDLKIPQKVVSPAGILYKMESARPLRATLNQSSGVRQYVNYYQRNCSKNKKEMRYTKLGPSVVSLLDKLAAKTSGSKNINSKGFMCLVSPPDSSSIGRGYIFNSFVLGTSTSRSIS